VTNVLLCVPYQIDSLNSGPTQKTSDIANLTLGQVCQKEGFSLKKKMLW